jgi:uncharacterized membrane protein
MQTLARYAMSGFWPAVLVVSLLGVGAWVLFPLMYLSGALLALIAMQLGPSKAVQVVVACLLLQGAAGAALMASPVSAMALASLLWVPLVALGGRVWQRASLPSALSMVAVLGLVAVVAFYALHDDPAHWWQQRVEGVLATQMGRMVEDGPGTEQNLSTILQGVAPYLPGAFAAVWVMGLAVSLVMGRWLQSRLYRAGAFGAEFQAWRLPRGWTAVALVCAAGALWRSDAAVNLLVPLTVVLCLPALGLLHGLLRDRSAGRLYLGLLYAALLVMPHLAMILAGISLLDSWMDFRGRARKSE